MPAQAQGILSTLLFPILLLAFFYFAIIRPSKKREEKANQMRSSLKVGDNIVTIGGIVGKVSSVKEDEITIEVGSDRTKFVVKKWAISTVQDKNVK